MLEQSYKATIAHLEQKLSETSGQLLLYNKELLKAQDDTSTVHTLLYVVHAISKNFEFKKGSRDHNKK